MTNPTTFERLREIIEIEFGIAATRVEMSSQWLDGLGLSPWETAELMAESEQIFGIDLDDVSDDVETVGDFVRLIDSKLSEAKEEEGMT